MSKLHSYFTGTVAALLFCSVSTAWAGESDSIQNNLIPQNSTTWSNKDGSSWLMRSNWSNGVPDDDGNTDVVIWVDGETRIDIPEDGVRVNELTVAGSGVLTIAGGKISSSYINIGTDVVASQSTLALSPMQILPG